MSMFKKAQRTQSKLKLALLGPSGSGKTYTALQVAKHLGQRIAVIDSERGSASLYAGDVADFDVLELESFAPRNYVRAIKAAEAEGYDVVVVDSLTHAWSGKDGALDMVEKARQRTRSQNSFTAWRDITPEHNALVDALVGCNAHLIATMRVKTAYELQEDDRGKKVPVKLGLAPVQRDGLEYEFSIVGDIDLNHVLTISKTRCAALDQGVYKNPGKDFADTITSWLNGAAPAPEPVKATAQPSTAKEAFVAGAMEALASAASFEALTGIARTLIANHGPVSGTPQWKAFAAKCADIEVAPRDVVTAAEQEAAQ